MKRTLFFFFILFFMLSGVLLFGQTEDIDRLIDQGIKQERDGDINGAAETYKKVLEEDPGNVMVKVRLAKILSWKNEFEEALLLLEDVLLQNPEHLEAMFRKAQILSWKGEYKESITMYKRYLEFRNDNPDALLGIARVYFWSGKYDEAIKSYENALEMGADEAEVLLDLGKVYLALNDREKARETFQRVLEKDPENREAERFLKGIRLEKTYEASPVYTRINIYPDDSVGIAYWSEFVYHPENKWDLVFGFQHTKLRGMADTGIYFTGVYRGIKGLYLRGGLEVNPNPNFSQWLGIDTGINYTFGTILGAGLSFKADIYTSETLFTIIPELRKDFTDLTWVGLKYNFYIYNTGYNTGRVELILNLEYIENNDLFVKAVYGGDVETRDPARRVFDFASGISINLHENLETSLSYAWIETPYGRSSEISWSNYIRW
ncbi:MAG: tetratricopeptide repeat protein [Spirochaetota bacterium]|nr:MAG: tetratricopeptide repeat protein [Spirochaetota bacterium]